MPIERIILYIDDLDRCRPERVIEVLEAVHLLLAFKLFMVVVAVDPRWLRRCLEKHYPELLALGAQEEPRALYAVPIRPVTAQDYLEKIFQIPYTLQPLKNDGYRRLVRGLTSLNIVPEVATPVTGHPASGNVQLNFSPVPVPPVLKASVQAPEGVGSALAVHPPLNGEGEDGGNEIERLTMRSWELQDIERLAPLFRTPRAVKRFVNTYRFLRAGVRPHELASFEGTRDNPGTYRGGLTLLAVVVSYSNTAHRFLQIIIDRNANGGENQDWMEFLKTVQSDAGNGDPGNEKDRIRGTQKTKKSHKAKIQQASRSWEEVEWQQLCDAMQKVSTEDFPIRTIDELFQWVRIVARYSFSLSSIQIRSAEGKQKCIQKPGCLTSGRKTHRPRPF
jgi:hypothetical protein